MQVIKSVGSLLVSLNIGNRTLQMCLRATSSALVLPVLPTSDFQQSLSAAIRGTSLNNTELLRDLIDASHAENIAFLNHVSSVTDLDKMNLSLRNTETRYAE